MMMPAGVATPMNWPHGLVSSRTVSSACFWLLTLFPTLVFPAQVIESMTPGQPVVCGLVVLPVPLDVGLVGGGGPKA